MIVNDVRTRSAQIAFIPVSVVRRDRGVALPRIRLLQRLSSVYALRKDTEKPL